MLELAELHELAMQIKKLGTNVNQLAKQANRSQRFRIDGRTVAVCAALGCATAAVGAYSISVGDFPIPLREVVAYLDSEHVPVCATALYRRVTFRTMTSGFGTLYQMSDKDESVRKARYNANRVVRELLAASQGSTDETAA